MGQTIQVSRGHQEERYIVRMSQPSLGVLSVKFPRDKYIINYYSVGLDLSVLKMCNRGLEFDRHNHHTKGSYVKYKQKFTSVAAVRLRGLMLNRGIIILSHL